MQLHEFMCPYPKFNLPRKDLNSLFSSHSSNLVMGMDFAQKKIILKNYELKFDDNLKKEDFGNYKPVRNFYFYKQMLSLVTEPIQIISDFEDCRGVISEVLFKTRLNCFTYNRKRGFGDEILWRLPSYFEPNKPLKIDGEIFKDELDFSQKSNKVFARLGLSGSNWNDNYKRDTVLSLKNELEFLNASERYSRIKAVVFSNSNLDFTDFKLTGKHVHKILKNKLDIYISDPVCKKEILQYKYILCPNGNDVSTQLYWIIGTNSVAFKEDCEYEILCDYYLKPWIHYVPISKNFIDLREKYDFIERNPDIAKKIIENANLAYEKISFSKEWRNAELTVLEKLGYIR